MLAPVAIVAQGGHVSTAHSATADHHVLCRPRCFTSRSAISDIPPYEKSAKSAGAIVLNLHKKGANLIANLVESVIGVAEQKTPGLLVFVSNTRGAASRISCYRRRARGLRTGLSTWIFPCLRKMPSP
jgi:hypothetical protein